LTTAGESAALGLAARLNLTEVGAPGGPCWEGPVRAVPVTIRSTP
jgi:hypothetical protein